MYTIALIKCCPIPQSYPRPDMYWSKNSFQQYWRVALKKSTLLSALSASLSRRIFEYCLFGLKNSTLLSALPLYLDEGSLHPTFSLIHPHNTIQYPSPDQHYPSPPRNDGNDDNSTLYPLLNVLISWYQKPTWHIIYHILVITIGTVPPNHILNYNIYVFLAAKNISAN